MPRGLQLCRPRRRQVSRDFGPHVWADLARCSIFNAHPKTGRYVKKIDYTPYPGTCTFVAIVRSRPDVVHQPICSSRYWSTTCDSEQQVDDVILRRKHIPQSQRILEDMYSPAKRTRTHRIAARPSRFARRAYAARASQARTCVGGGQRATFSL